MRAGVENYSIKRLEPLCGYCRRVDLAEATASLIALEAALEDGTAAGDGERQRVVAGYNEDDCRATLALRDWLEGRRIELAGRLGEELPRPVFDAGGAVGVVVLAGDQAEVDVRLHDAARWRARVGLATGGPKSLISWLTGPSACW